MKKAIYIAVSLLYLGCGDKRTHGSGAPPPVAPEFADYWYRGLAEITSYKLQQARYGEIHEGTAVAIFVTEDFSAAKQVKLDHPSTAGDDAVKILKLNLVKKFTTGIYPYSMMLSVFKPIAPGEGEHPLKVTASSQEWCGHTFTQVNAGNDTYGIKLLSYFESEGDRAFELPKVWMEDEVWTHLRIDPSTLPTGQIKIIPGLLQQRLMHTDLQVETATASIQNEATAPSWLGEKAPLSSYTLRYEAYDRELNIYFSPDFPFAIAGWEEHYPDGFGKNKGVRTTRAVKSKTLHSDYWNHNRSAGKVLRDSLDLR